jgi:hypothetical protein
MVRSSTRIAGSSGALPVWIKATQGIILEQNYAGALDIVDMVFAGGSEVPLYYPDVGQIAAPVAVLDGGLLLTPQNDTPDKTQVVTFGKVLAGGEVVLGRYFRPYWHNM